MRSLKQNIGNATLVKIGIEYPRKINRSERKKSKGQNPKKRKHKQSNLSNVQLIDIIRYPIITEKAISLWEQNKYIFFVSPEAIKPDIKKAIEYLFDVKVIKVNTINPPRKKRRVGRFIGYKPHYKKAIVTLAKGNSITLSLFPDI